MTEGTRETKFQSRKLVVFIKQDEIPW